MSNIITTEDLCFSYDSNLVIDKVCLQIKEGDFVSIVGANGSGKSTLAKLFNALLAPSSGKLNVNGFDALDGKNKKNIRSSCGMVFQNPDNAMVSSIVEDDVAFGPENLGIEQKKIIEAVSDALDMVDMLPHRDKDPMFLSGGQKQRVAIAGVLAMAPKIIIFDEATSMLDKEGTDHIREVMKKINSNGTTIINITHDMEEVLCSNRVIVLSKGKIVLDGTPNQIFNEGIMEFGLMKPFLYRLRDDLGLDIKEVSEEKLIGKIKK